jgi:hypothetical protein
MVSSGFKTGSTINFFWCIKKFNEIEEMEANKINGMQKSLYGKLNLEELHTYSLSQAVFSS